LGILTSERAEAVEGILGLQGEYLGPEKNIGKRGQVRGKKRPGNIAISK